MIEYRHLRVALLGAGSVGAQVAALLLEQRDEFASRVGAPLELVGHRGPRPRRAAHADLPRELLTTDATLLILGADIVVELMGGIEPARELRAARRSTPAPTSITANKALLATHGPELFDAAEQVGAQLYYEAAVGGAIPIIRPLRDSLAGDRVRPHPRHRQRHDQLRARPDGRDGDGLDEALADGHRARLRGGGSRPPTSGATTRRRRPRSSPASPSTPPCRSRRSTARASPASPPTQVRSAREAGHVVKLLAICERITDPATATRASPPACIRRCCRAPIRSPPCTARTTPSSSQAESAGEPHVLRRGRRRRRDRIRGARRPGVGRPAARRSAARASPVRRTRTCRCSTSASW